MFVPPAFDFAPVHNPSELVAVHAELISRLDVTHCNVTFPPADGSDVDTSPFTVSMTDGATTGAFTEIFTAMCSLYSVYAKDQEMGNWSAILKERNIF